MNTNFWLISLTFLICNRTHLVKFLSLLLQLLHSLFLFEPLEPYLELEANLDLLEPCFKFLNFLIIIESLLLQLLYNRLSNQRFNMFFNTFISSCCDLNNVLSLLILQFHNFQLDTYLSIYMYLTADLISSSLTYLAS